MQPAWAVETAKASKVAFSHIINYPSNSITCCCPSHYLPVLALYTYIIHTEVYASIYHLYLTLTLFYLSCSSVLSSLLIALPINSRTRLFFAGYRLPSFRQFFFVQLYPGRAPLAASQPSSLACVSTYLRICAAFPDSTQNKAQRVG